MINKEKNSKISRNLKNLYLDPNNYRFADNNNYKKIIDDEVLNDNIQKRTRNFIEGKNKDGVKDLLDSFKANGFLDVDRIQLKDLGGNNYLVLEGNRRVTALKILQEYEKNGIDIGVLDVKIFSSVPSVIYNDNDDTNHLIVMGLKHINGNKKWPAINQAKLIYDYLDPFESNDYHKEEQKLCESLGITRAKLRGTQRAYHLILQYKQSDYGDQFRSEMYYTFAEITKRPAIKKWIKWNDNDYIATNDENCNTLFSWLSKTEDIIDLDDETDEVNEKIAIITKYREIQDLAKFIDNKQAVAIMENTRSISQGLLASGNIEKESYKKSILNLKNSIVEIERLQDIIPNEYIKKLKTSYVKLSNILPNTSSLDIQIDNISVCFEKGNISHFTKIYIEKYKLFNAFEINDLKRINIFAGFNNVGKSTLLEAIYLLTKQNNMQSFFEITKLRNKLDSLNTVYLNDYMKDDIEISGIFNETQTKIKIKKIEDVSIDKKDDYIASYKIDAFTDNEHLNSLTHTFEYNGIQRFYKKIEILCNSIFKSPYFYNKNEIIDTHSKNVEIKEFKLVIDFLHNFIDNNINNIELTESSEIKRFLVDSKSFNHSVDITSYGEGLQRIFEIALSFAYCKNGVLLIDELETAIHYSLLIDFTKFIQELAVKFNVQVFVTTHSKECIRAFVKNNTSNEDISFSTMVRDNNNDIKMINYDANTLLNDLEQDLEIRGW
jgi:AAA15 family ATPase/GTPase